MELNRFGFPVEGIAGTRMPLHGLPLRDRDPGQRAYFLVGVTGQSLFPAFKVSDQLAAAGIFITAAAGLNHGGKVDLPAVATWSAGSRYGRSQDMPGPPR